MELIYINSVWSATISAVIGAVVAAVVSRVKMAERSRRERVEDGKKLEALIRQNTLLTCRIVIYDEHFSVDEKLETYKLYRSLGGNHQTKEHMSDIVHMDVDEYIRLHEGK